MKSRWHGVPYISLNLIIRFDLSLLPVDIGRIKL
jgi:hypothetical protein